MSDKEPQETSAQEAEESQTFTGKATDKDVDDIVRHPTKYGLEWDEWDAQSRTDAKGNPFGSLVMLRKASKTLPKVIDAEKFAHWFGYDKLVKAYNGTSGRVDAQQVTRTLILAAWSKDRGKSVTETEIRSEVVKRILLGMRAKGGGGGARKVWIVNGVAYADEAAAIEASKSSVRKVFTALDGTEHATGLEAKQASVAWLVEKQGMTPQVAAAMVANLPE